MTRHLVIFFACFLVGAVVTTVIRTSRHQPYGASADAQAMPGALSPPLTTAPPAMAPVTTPMATPPMMAAAASTTPVNSICAICGMPVNSAIPTSTYQGKVIGFGCKTCPPRFAKEPDKFGPAALANRVVEE